MLLVVAGLYTGTVTAQTSNKSNASGSRNNSGSSTQQAQEKKPSAAQIIREERENWRESLKETPEERKTAERQKAHPNNGSHTTLKAY